MKKIYCMLTGGLGNQLFQFAAALDRKPELIILDSTLGIPRSNNFGEPIISEFNLANNVVFASGRRESKFASKCANYLLRSGINPKGIERLKLYRYCTNLAGHFVMSLWLRSKVRVTQATDLGFFKIEPTSKNELHLGYFQSFLWSENINTKIQLNSISLKSVPPSLRDFLRQNNGKKALSIHVRLGDYKNQPGFGLLPKVYYEKAIESLMSNSEFDVIWLFSDEPEAAVQMIPEEFLAITLLVPDFADSASATLEAMRHADGYVIANSSLSWWGARLSYSKNPMVVAPQPWFQNDPEPNSIIPPEWSRIKAWE